MKPTRAQNKSPGVFADDEEFISRVDRRFLLLYILLSVFAYEIIFPVNCDLPIFSDDIFS